MPTDTLVTEKQFARTYDGGAYDDAYAVLEQYREFHEYKAENPDKGYVSIANALEIPRGRSKSWDDGATPNVAEGVETARDHSWLNLTYDDRQFTALNTLVANIYSGGSINPDNWVPKFVLNERGFDSHCIDALELAGVGYTEVDTDGDRGPVVRPGDDAAILGRALRMLGAPTGKKSQLDDFALPPYLTDAPTDVRETFVQCYLANRAYTIPDGASLQIIEERPRSYREELAVLIESVADAPVTVGDESVTISADAARALGIERDQLARS